MTRAQGLGRAFLVLATTAGALFTVLVAGGSGKLEVSLVRVVYDGMAVAVLVPWLLVAAFRRDWLPSSLLLPALLAVLAAFAISTITSRAPRLSAEMFGYAVLLAEGYLLLVIIMRRPRMRAHFERLAVVLCILVCVQYLLQVFQSWQALWTIAGHLTIPPLRPERPDLSLGSPNPIATFVLISGAFVLATGPVRGRGRWVASASLVALVAVTTLITGSRGAWLGGAAALGACGLAAALAVPAARTRATAFLRTRPRLAVLGLGLAALGVVGGVVVSSGRLTLNDGGAREAFASASLRMFQSSPVVGVGPGVWQVLRASHETAMQPDQYIPHAHNIYLQTLAEFGVVGVLAGLVVAGSLIALILAAIRSGDDGRRRVGLATLFAVVVLAGQQLVDMLMNVPALLLAAALPLAWLDATAPDHGAEPAPAAAGFLLRGGAPGFRARLSMVGLTALTLVIAVGLVRIEAIATGASRGVSAADAGRWAEAVGPALEAAISDPEVNSYWFMAGVAAANAGDLATAADALERSARADDYPFAWLDLAAVRWRLGDVTGARAALTSAERLGLQRVSVAVAAGWLRWQLGDRTAAISDYAAAVVAAPTLAGDPMWASDPELDAARTAIVEAARQQVDPDNVPLLFAVQLFGGDAAGATAELAPLSAADRALYDQVVAAWQGLPGAEAALHQLAEDAPLDRTVVAWCRLIAARHDEGDLVGRYSTWLRLTSGSPPGLPVARIVFAPPIPQRFDDVDRYGSLYRRLVPAAQVIGILPQILLRDRF